MSRTYYVICDDNCKFEGMTKEEIYDAIAEATGSTPTPVDEAFITKIKEQRAQQPLKFWKGSKAQFSQIANPDSNTIYIIDSNVINDTVPIERGGTGADSAASARAALGALGTNDSAAGLTGEITKQGLSAFLSRCTFTGGYVLLGDFVFVDLHITMRENQPSYKFWTLITGFPHMREGHYTPLNVCFNKMDSNERAEATISDGGVLWFRGANDVKAGQEWHISGLYKKNS